MADRYWVGGSAAWDATAGTKWATTDGGVGGASVPTASDNVYFTALSGTVTVTMGTTNSCLSFNCTGFTGTISNVTGYNVNVYGNFTLSSTMTLTPTTGWQFQMLGTTVGGSYTITTAGKTMPNVSITVATTATVTLQDALTSAGSITVSQGIFSTNNFAVTAVSLLSSTSTSRTINLGSSTLTLSAAAAITSSTQTNLTFNAGTSQINCTSGSITLTLATGVTFYNVAFTSTSSGTKTITGANTFNNLSVTGPATVGVTNVAFAANQTINGTLSTTGTAGNRRVFFASSTYGIGWNLTCNSAASLTDADFRDIYVLGTAAPISGTRIGNRGNCTGITFDVAKTVYWNLAAGGNWSATAWATSSGGAVSTDNFPLPQDTATIVNTGLNSGATITLDTAITFVGTLTSAARTVTWTLAGTTAYTFYGSVTLRSPMTALYSGTATFAGSATHDLSLGGYTLGSSLEVSSFGGTVRLLSATTISSNLIVTAGTFNTQGYSLIVGGNIVSTSAYFKTLDLSTSTVYIYSSTPLNISVPTTLQMIASSANISLQASSPSFNGYGYIIGRLAFDNTSNNQDTGTITGDNTTFTNLFMRGASFDGFSILSIGATGIRITGTLTCSGTDYARRVFMRSSVVGTPRTIVVGTLTSSYCDFRDIVITGTAAGTSPSNAGDCGGNSGITFPAPKTVYWNLAGSQSWAAVGWATSSGGAPAAANFPLAQDTAIVDNTGAITTLTMFAGFNIGTFDASARTTAMTFSTSTGTPYVYGDWKWGTGVTSSSTTGTLFFSKTGTQTITSNGVSFNCPVQAGTTPNGYVQLADALTLGSSRALYLGRGTFDAVSYNVTAASFTNYDASSTLKMGAGIWTMTGTGVVWGCSTAPIMYAGTSTIVLSSTSTAARTFDGGGLYYNKLTIGGTTGTSTLTITGNNTFGELASTKTVAHTIAFGTTIQNFGKWSVTGTVGNVVTLTGTSTTNNIYGPAVTGVDYLAMGSWGISTTSPGEFYAGANSTGTAAAPVYRTAAPAPRTLYWVGGTGNWSSTTKWSTSSGGASGAAIPTSLDTVTFDSASNATAYTATIDAGVTIARCAAFTMAGPASGNVTFAGTSVPVAFHGNVTFAATGITRTYTGTMNWVGNSSYTFTTNGVSMGSIMYVLSPAATWELGSALTSSSYIDLVYGSFSTSASNYSMNITSIYSSYSSPRTLLLNASSITLSSSSVISWATSTGLTVNAGTSTITSTSAAPTFAGGGQTFYNVSFTNTNASAISITGGNTFNALTWGTQTGLGVGTLTLSANQTITGTLTLGSTLASAYRKFVRSDTIGTTRTLTVNALAAGAADIDFRDITVAGAAAPISGTRFGDCKGNSGITFPAAKTVYYGQTGSTNWGTSGSGSWSATSGGALDATQFPLAQDTAVFPAATYPASNSTTTINVSYNIGTIDMSLRTSNTMTLSTGINAPTIYGNWINGTGVTLSGTGTIVFAGRGSQTITSAGKVFTQQLDISCVGGTVTLQDAFVATITGSTVLHKYGTFDANGYSVQLYGDYFSSYGNVRTLAIGSATWNIGGAFNASLATNLTVTGTGYISLYSASAKTFFGGGANYSGVSLNQGGAGTLTISGNNTFANITNSYSLFNATAISFGATTQTVSAFTATGTAGKLLTLTGTSAASPATLVYTGASPLSGVGYLNTNFIRAYPTTSTWVVGTTSNNGGSLGFSFASGGTVYNVTISETSTASESMLAYALFLASLSETTTAADTVEAAQTFLSDVSETATATDSVISLAEFYAAADELAAVSDTTATAQAYGASVANSANASETTATAQAYGASVANSANASETTATAQAYGASVANSANASDTAVAVQAYGASVANSANASETTATAQAYGASVANSANASDTAVAVQVFITSVSNSVNASETAAAVQSFSASVANSATATTVLRRVKVVSVFSENFVGTATEVYDPSTSVTAAIIGMNAVDISSNLIYAVVMPSDITI